MHDSDTAVQELYQLTVQDATISDRQKKKLLKAFPCDTEEDTLLIVDNFNATADEDDQLAEVMAYRCKVLFTTRCRYDECPMLELNEISDKQTLLRFMSNFYSEAAQHQDAFLLIIDAVHSHTLAVELAARLLETGMLEPHALLAKLQAEKASFDDPDTVNIHKDRHSTTELTSDLLNALIEKNTVHEATKDADGSRMQEVEIYYRFIGKIE